MAATASVDIRTVFLEIHSELEGWVRRRCRSADLAADIVQDIYVRLHRITEPFASWGDARAYLYRMAANAAIDHHKVEARRAEILQSAAPLQEEISHGPEAAVFAKDQVRLIREALKELPKHCYEMLILSRVHGLTNAEVAKKVGVSKSLVEKYIAMALTACRDKLGSL